MEAYKILAVDYDDTIFHTDSSTYDLIPDWDIISQIRERQKEGWDIVLLTTMEDRWDLGHAIKMCEDFAIHFTAITITHGGCTPLRDSQIRFTGMS